VHCCCDTFFTQYPDEIARLAARQSGSNIDASETPRLRLLDKGCLLLEDGGVAAKRDLIKDWFRKHRITWKMAFSMHLRPCNWRMAVCRRIQFLSPRSHSKYLSPSPQARLHIGGEGGKIIQGQVQRKAFETQPNCKGAGDIGEFLHKA